MVKSKESLKSLLRVESYESRNTSYEFRFFIYVSTSRVTSSSAWISSLNPRVKSLSLYGTSFNPPVTEFKSAR